jgi:hypothetical protein
MKQLDASMRSVPMHHLLCAGFDAGTVPIAIGVANNKRLPRFDMSVAACPGKARMPNQSANNMRLENLNGLQN